VERPACGARTGVVRCWCYRNRICGKKKKLPQDSDFGQISREGPRWLGWERGIDHGGRVRRRGPTVKAGLKRCTDFERV